MLGKIKSLFARESKASLPGIWRHEWEHPDLPKWQARLEEVFPRNDLVNWLKIVWEPGMPRHPKDRTGTSEQYVHRWVIYEMIPRLEFIPPWALQSCYAPNPRMIGEDVYEDGTWWWSSHSWISRTQWMLFRETGCFAMRYWVVQGDHGGHFTQLGPAEKKFLAERGRMDAEVPAVGDLPYAEMDNRTIWKLLEFDKLQSWDQNITWDQRQSSVTKAGLYVREQRERAEMGFNVAMLDFLDDMIKQGVESLPRSEINKVVQDAPRVSDREWDYEAVEEGAVADGTNWGDS